MEKDETFVLMSMKDNNSKDLANAISNETSRKIIAYLSEKGEATETQLAKELNSPLTTIHYNIKLLLNSKLIESKEFFPKKFCKLAKSKNSLKSDARAVVMSNNTMDKQACPEFDEVFHQVKNR